MAEGGYENPVFDRDDYDEEEETSFQDDEEFQKSINNENEILKDLSEEGFSIREDNYGRPMLYVKDGYGKEIALTYYQKEVLQFYKFSTLQREYGVGGVDFVRDVLGVDDYKLPERTIEGRAEFQRMLNEGPIRELNNIEIPLQEISTQQEVQELLETASNSETYFKEIETSFVEEGTTYREIETQTDMTKKRDGWYNQCNDIKKLRSQVNRIKETIYKVLNEDTTLGERIKTLIREQGITIASILTAFGMIIGVIVETFTSGSTSSSPPPPKPSKCGGQDWIKNN
ncbi:unnamed protein product [Mytilus edulis]|uniref:Uncharacterized protein n=1 Tax=Mytilus edulis TaxID=6550 RepID=A0A8S3T5F1_MYTED|nr:unnamed protein product [Mytilus edulis]